MKKLVVLFLAIVAICVMCTPVQNKKQVSNTANISENALMPQKQIVRYFTELRKDSIHNRSLAKYQKTNIDIAEYIFDKALKGEISVYENDESGIYKPDTLFKKLTVDDIKEKLGAIEQTVSYTDENGNEVTQTIQLEVKPLEITEIGFVEEWEMNETEFSMTKKVLLYNFVREYERDNGEKRKLVSFTVQPNILANAKPNWELACTKVSEVYIDAATISDVLEYGKERQEKWQAGNALFNERNAFWNHYTYNKFVSLVFNKVNRGSAKPYDFVSQQVLDSNEIENRLGVVETTISYYNEDGEEVTTTIKQEPNVNEISSVVFIEDWYFDKNTLALKKEIKGIAPVRYYFNGQTNSLVKDIVFVVPFN